MSHWSVIRTRSRWEKKVAALLTEKGIETFCPLVKARHQWSDRLKTVEKPLLKSYVFVKASEEQRTVVRLTEGVVNFVYREGKPVLLKEKLVQNILVFQQTYPDVTVLEVSPQEGLNGHATALTGRQKPVVLLIDTLNLALVACAPEHKNGEPNNS